MQDAPGRSLLSPLTVSVAKAAGGLATPSWRRLASYVDHPFAQPEWFQTWSDAFAEGIDQLVVVVRRDGADVAILPLCARQRDRTLMWMGGADLTDYLGPICAPAIAGEVAGAMARFLVDNRELWKQLDLRFLAPGSRFGYELARALQGAGLEATLDYDGVTCRLALPSAWSAYLSGLSKKDRHELRRKRRRYEAVTGAAPRIRRSMAATAERDVARFVALHRRSKGRKAAFMGPAVAAFFRDLAERYLELGMLDLEFLELEGEPIAATMSFTKGGRKFLYNMAYDPNAAALSPGVVMLSELICRGIDSRLTVLDLLRGDEGYKLRLGAQPEYLLRLRTPRG
jgi:CelD/BcsL family acetyltransferase involved in cellulose biosynthesis